MSQASGWMSKPGKEQKSPTRPKYKKPARKMETKQKPLLREPDVEMKNDFDVQVDIDQLI